jgi:hypothetical protein
VKAPAETWAEVGRRDYRVSISGRQSERTMDLEQAERLLVALAERGVDFAVLTPGEVTHA